MRKILFLLAAILLSIGLFNGEAGAGGKKSKGWWSPPLTYISIDPQYWSIRYSIGMPPKPTANPSGPGWYFDFPVHATSTFDDCNQTTCITPDEDFVAVSCCESIHYLTVPYVGPLPAGQSLKATIDISTTGNAVFLHQTQPGNCGAPATARFFVQVLENRHPPPYIMLDSNARWWSNPVALTLQNTGGSVVLSVPIDPSQWSNVDGQMGNANAETLAGFQSAMQTHDAIGFTFGACGFGHGVGLAAGGTARFTLTDMRVE